MEKKLDPKFKAKWVKALRSGKFIQGKSFLKNRDSNGNAIYCCLGVACEIAGHNPRGGWYITRNMKKVPKPLIGQNDLTEKLSRMNDCSGKGFKAIATWIEKNL